MNRLIIQDRPAFMTRFLPENGLPGGAVAVTQEGRLVPTAAFGVANPGDKRPSQRTWFTQSCPAGDQRGSAK